MLVDLVEGAIFAGRYRVTCLLAAGAMGAVYEAVHLETERRRALKVLHPHVADHGRIRERFKLEARIAANVESEHIVEVFDAGVDEATGRPFLVMELLRGEELGKRLARAGRFPVPEALTYLRQTALALERTHRARIVHRDLKPSNLFRTEREDGSPRIKVLDFGVAKLLAETSSGDATRVAGTPVYMAPEQMRGEAITRAVDIYALGMMAYTFLTGEPYWAATRERAADFVAFAMIAAGGPDEPAGVRAARRGATLPPGFDAWFARATAPDPDQRFASAIGAVTALEVVLLAGKALPPELGATIEDPDAVEPDVAEIPTASIRGKPLRAYVGDEGVPIDRKIRWLAGAARALAEAARSGASLGAVTADDVVVYADGRLALRADAVALAGDTTARGGATLTDDESGAPPIFLAPEQILGAPADERSAQFAWGVIAYELFTGAPPWSDGEPASLLMRIATEPVAPLSSRAPAVPEGIARVVMRAIEKRPEDRHASLFDIAEQLDAAVRGAPGDRGGIPRGTLFAERFEIERTAGSGGMGAVYRALDRRTDAPVAIKILHVHRAEHGERLAREAEVIADLRHPAIVGYVAHGKGEHGRAYLAMEWVEGETLAARLERGPLDAAQTIALGKRLASAIAAAHRRGLVHRDVKPSNVLLPGGDVAQAKLADFGIVRAPGPSRRHTATGELLGTPGYMAPEQARGEADVDARADVFSLGCVLFQCLAGRPAFEGDDWMSVLLKLVLGDVPRVSELAADVPPALDELIARMLDKARESRPADGAAVAAELDRLARPSYAAIAAPRVLTTTELRAMCIVLARPPRGEPVALVAQDFGRAKLDELREVAAPLGARLDVLANGSVLAVLTLEEQGEGAAIDLALRAARCALALRRALPRGSMALVMGRGELGDPAGASALFERGVRLCAGEPTPGVRVDDAVAGLVGARFHVRADEVGLALQGERDEVTSRRTLLGKDTPCVGRDREIGVLLGMLDECEGERISQAALLLGPPGIGKSRVLDELLRRARARRPDFSVWIGRGDPMSAGSPFGIVGQALRRAAGLLPGEPPEAQQAKLRARLGRYVKGPALARVAAFAGEIAGVPFPAEGVVEIVAARASAMVMSDQVRRAFADLCEAECRAAPLLLVLEDLHWGDRPSIDLVDAALRALDGLPFMVLALARPEVHALVPELWPARRVQTIRLGELHRRASVAMVRAGLGAGASDEVVDGIVERAAGNAFFLEELVRAEAEGRDEALPETVLAVVESRLARLSPESRRTLRAASVFGRAFRRAGLLALLGGGASLDLADVLEELTQRELVVRRSEEEHAFRHALVRDAAYAMLTEEDRALGHRLAGAFLEGAGERDAALLGEHFERGGEPGRAAGCYRRAAEQALEGSDLDNVVALAERGLGCGAAGQARGELFYLQAEALNWRSRYPEAAAKVREAIAHLAPGHEMRSAALGVGALASFQRGDVVGLSDFSEALLATVNRGSSAWIVAASRAGVCLYNAGAIDLGDALLEHIERAEREGTIAEAYTLAAVHRVYATRAKHRGESSLPHFAASVDYAEQAGSLRQACTARVNIGFSLIQLGAYAEAERALVRGLESAEALGIANVASVARQNLGLARARLGEREEGKRLLTAALGVFEAQSAARDAGACLIYLATIAEGEGDLDAAAALAARAVEALASTPPMRAYALAALASAHLAAGRTEAASVPAREGAALLQQLGGVEEGEALIRLVRASLSFAEGQREEGREALREARDRLLDRAGKIADPALRASFLQAIPEHARTLALARAELG